MSCTLKRAVANPAHLAALRDAVERVHDVRRVRGVILSIRGAVEPRLVRERVIPYGDTHRT